MSREFRPNSTALRHDSSSLTVFVKLSSLCQDYEECFLRMTTLPGFQNVASRMVAGRYAYDRRERLCLEDDSEKCTQTLEVVLRGACNLNFITMW